MLEPGEWAILEEAHAAGMAVEQVLDRARAQTPDSHPFRSLRSLVGVGDLRDAWLALGFELFTGIRERRMGRLPHHRTSLYGPPCAECGKPLRTPGARRCVECGHRVSDAPDPTTCERGRIRLHRRALPTLSIADVLEAGPSLLLSVDDFVGRIIMPSDEEDWLLTVLADPAFGLVQTPAPLPSLACMVETLFSFHHALASDLLYQYMDTEQGNELPQVLVHCSLIGADRAQSLAQALLDLYPIELRTDASGRCELLAELEMDEGSSPTLRLAEAHWDAVREIPARLHAYVSAHLGEFEAALGQTRAARRRKAAAANVPYETGPFAGGSDLAKQLFDAATEIAQWRARMPAGRHSTFPPHTGALAIGTLLELRDGIMDDAMRVYLQVTHHHALEPFHGPVVRVIDGWHDARPNDLAAVAARPTVRVGLLPGEISPAKIAADLGVFPVPLESREFPAFRSRYGVSPYGVTYWGLWTGSSESVAWKAEPLPPQIEVLPELGAPQPAQRLIQGDAGR